ncbi:MAG TPA: PQQ-binding-like beta-propeller repeat protein [Thermoleophilaceae bacterium]
MRGLDRGVCAAAAAVVASALVPAAALGAASNYQADAAHSGFVGDGPNPPLGRKWIRRDLGTSVSYPVIAEGKVFVTAVTGTPSSSSSSTTGPTLLYALDRRTGGTVWVREVATFGSPAYEDGRVFVLGERALDAVSAATGERLWRRDMDLARGAVPVPDGPFVYASDEDGAHAVSADTGLVVQTEPFPKSGFAVVGERVFVSREGCARLASYTRGLAQQVWERAGCAGGNGAPASPAFHSIERTVPFERLWARSAGGQGGIVVDAITSLGTEQFGSEGGIAFGGEFAFLRHENSVEARNVSSGTIQWRWDAPPPPPAAGDGGTPSAGLAGSALAVRDAVWTVTAAGEVVALQRGDGRELFRTSLAGQAPQDWNSSYSPSRLHHGMAADGDGLIVPGHDRVVALGPGGDAPGVLDPDKEPGGTTSMTAQVAPRDLGFGRKVLVSGEVRRAQDSYVSDQIELQADPYPYGVWERVAGAAARDGSFQLSHVPDRNTRYRVVDTSTAPAVESKTFQVYVYPRFRVRLGYRGRTRVLVSTTIDAPDFLNLGKQRLYVYRLRTRRSVGTRIASIPIKRGKGTRYRAARTIRVPAARPSDYFYVCVKLKDTRQLTRLNGRKWGCGRSRF